MFINPKLAIERGWITGIRDPLKQVQPNAIDFTVDSIKSFELDTAFVGETSKVMRRVSLVSTPWLEGKGWDLNGKQVYDGTSDAYVKLPEGVAAILWTRSTFTRNGVFIVSGLYDSGYQGHIGFTIYTMGGPIVIEPGTRIGQIGFVTAENAGLYAGGWNHEEGRHHADQPAATAGAPPSVFAPKSPLARELEQATTISSEPSSPPAGVKTFI